MPKGTISQLDEETGHGLIEQEDSTVVRFHFSAVITTDPKAGVGDHVTYDSNGAVATNITVSASYKALGTSNDSRARPEEDGTMGGPEEDGIVKWWNSKKGYGFVEGKDGIDKFVQRKKRS